ncbi:MAG: hypothetical protein K2F74_01520 [Muribaculaceae bacterium]|nr:hypothetical protein [Muribaculaceae bacterium]MDE5929017.1 hypothetical protein [Muribaculaceae bacterium]MDE6130247.1 hypothetical protein [Muribaculaceae bacterium]
MSKNDKTNSWKGYDFDQLTCRRILTSARIEAQKTRLTETARTVKKENPILSMRNARTLFTALSFVDYGVLAIRLYRRIKPLFSK